MSLIPMGGWRIVPNPKIAKEHADWYWGMGLTAEAVAKEFNVSREDQDLFSYHSHQKAIADIKAGKFKYEIVPVIWPLYSDVVIIYDINHETFPPTIPKQG